MESIDKSLPEKYQFIELLLTNHYPDLYLNKSDDFSEKSNLIKRFQEWAGIDYEKFVNNIHPSNIKQAFRQTELSLFDKTPSIKRGDTLHLQAKVSITAMNDKERSNNYEKLTVKYQFSPTIFGLAIIGSTEKGICYIAFENNEEIAVENLKSRYPKANLIEKEAHFSSMVSNYFKTMIPDDIIPLHVPGTSFQLSVWKELLQIPFGTLSNYHQLAKNLNQPTASRAVGTAVGQNPIAFIIPCHRIIKSTGEIGQFKWGHIRKTIIIGWEKSFPLETIES